MMKLILPAVLTLSLGLTACATKQETGAVVGGVLGGVAASNVGKGRGKTAATIAGTIAGAVIGGAIGRNMDETDQLKAQRTLEYNKTGQPASWTNPDTGYQYEMTPTRTYQASQGNYCREYQTDVVVGGKREQAYGTACRQPDGSWKVIN